MPTTVIHVNQHVIKRNAKTGGRDPAITFKPKSGGRATYGHTALILDEFGNELARVVHRQEDPLPCGARCWVETKYRVVALSEEP
jgi:hypothetical protein